MILNEEQIQPLLNEQGLYDCKLVQQRFALKILGEGVSPLGDVLCFESPVLIGPLAIQRALVLAVELPNTDLFGGVCFQRLYATMLGSLLSITAGKNCFVDESCIFADGIQASLSMLNKIKDSVVFHIVLPMETDREEFCKLDLEGQQLEEFKFNAVESFKHLTKSIFIETRRDAF